MLSWAASGSPWYATDIGGFYGDQPDPELFVRWCQAAVFASHMRFHGMGAREPWSFGEEALRLCPRGAGAALPADPLHRALPWPRPPPPACR